MIKCSCCSKEISEEAKVCPIEPLLKRIFMFLEDGDWRRANEYCEKVLDMYPECALAYLGKLMAEYHRHTSGALGELHEPFDKSNNYQKAIRFGDSKLEEELNTCLDQVIARKEHARQEDIYLDARDKMNAAQTEAEFKLAAQIFDTVPDFQDAPALAQQCRHMAEDARKDAIYNKAQSLVDTDQLPMYMQAIPLYESIPDWKDSTQQIDFCRRRIVEKEAEATNNAKHRKTVALIAAILAAIVASIVIVYNLPSSIMSRRIKAFNELYELHQEYGSACSDLHEAYQISDSLYSRYNELIYKCGLDYGYIYDDDTYVMDADFVHAYIDKYSVDEFIEKLFCIYSNRWPCFFDDFHSYLYNGSYCMPRTVNSALFVAFEYAGIELSPFVIPEEGSDGYYTEHPKEVPAPETWEVSGSFYNSSGENETTQTRTCSSTVTVHGDVVIVHYRVYRYSSGAYGWRNGVFYDELPSWQYDSYDDIYFRGQYLSQNPDNAEVFHVGDTYYLLYYPDDCDFSDVHQSRLWEMLGQ